MRPTYKVTVIFLFENQCLKFFFFENRAGVSIFQSSNIRKSKLAIVKVRYTKKNVFLSSFMQVVVRVLS